jgi:hypothetical protein
MIVVENPRYEREINQDHGKGPLPRLVAAEAGLS